MVVEGVNKCDIWKAKGGIGHNNDNHTVLVDKITTII